LTQTGSYEQASDAIQHTPEMIQHHYGRLLPQDKAALAARILNQVWDATASKPTPVELPAIQLRGGVKLASHGKYLTTATRSSSSL